MPPIPVALFHYGPALLAMAATLAVAWFGRAKGRQVWLRPGVAIACLLGWAALEPLTRLRAAALAPGVTPAMLIVPAAGLVLIEAVRSWGGRYDRWLSVLAAGFVGWWLARIAAAPGEFWRVGIVVALLTGLVAWIVRQQPGRGLAIALALWGGLAVAGFPAGWLAAAAVLTAGWAGLLILKAPAAVPSALVAALLAGADLARGRLSRGHFDFVDSACLLALAAPFLAGLFALRLGKRWQSLAPALGAVAAIALTWGIHRAIN